MSLTFTKLCEPNTHSNPTWAENHRKARNPDASATYQLPKGSDVAIYKYEGRGKCAVVRQLTDKAWLFKSKHIEIDEISRAATGEILWHVQIAKDPEGWYMLVKPDDVLVAE